jgi:hypothetical protein
MGAKIEGKMVYVNTFPSLPLIITPSSTPVNPIKTESCHIRAIFYRNRQFWQGRPLTRPAEAIADCCSILRSRGSVDAHHPADFDRYLRGEAFSSQDCTPLNLLSIKEPFRAGCCNE